MNLSEATKETPGLNRRFVYYLESKGLIQPRKIWKSRIARRDYTPSDAHVIQETWRYYERGYSVQAAYELATQREQAVAWVRLGLPPREMTAALRQFGESPSVVEAAAVYGTIPSVIIEVETPSEAEVYETVVPIMSRWGVIGLPAISAGAAGTRARSGLRRRAEWRQKKGGSMLAYLMLSVPGKDVNTVLERLRSYEPVREAATVYGESDIVAKVEVENQEELDALVMGDLHALPQVESTRTFIVVQNMHWSR